MTWAETPAEARSQCVDVAWEPFKIVRLPAVQVDWVQEELPKAAEVKQDEAAAVA